MIGLYTKYNLHLKQSKFLRIFILFNEDLKVCCGFSKVISQLVAVLMKLHINDICVVQLMVWKNYSFSRYHILGRRVDL